MHELSVTESLINIAVKHAQQANASRVTDIYVVIGALSSIVDDSIQFYWDLISAGTVCEGAQLHFQRVPARLKCLDCHNVCTLAKEMTPCPACGSAHIHVESGEEFWLDSIEIEKDQEQV
jgi:hydrogenase nickel incorporation protein HypA/HybF